MECPIRHLLGSEGIRYTPACQEHLKEVGVEMKFLTMVEDIIIEG